MTSPKQQKHQLYQPEIKLMESQLGKSEGSEPDGGNENRDREKTGCIRYLTDD
jgi:hypothetical protein